MKNILLGLACMPLLPCHAEIVTDGSLGPKISLSGPDYEIRSNLGQHVGSNLFHSFGAFSVNTGESATFTGDSGLGRIDNILGRVTGGSLSNIDGRLASTIPGANLFLLNPAGIVFGPNASLDLPGSFHASTADFIRLADGIHFNALPSGHDALLTTAPPEAFGFLKDRPAPIEVNDSFLEVRGGKTLSLMAGDISVRNGSLYAPGGQINLISTASPGEVTPVLSGPKLDADVTAARLGRIAISRNATQGAISDVDTSGPVGGAVVIRGGQFVLENAAVAAQTSGGNDGEKGAGIDIRVGQLDMHSLDPDKPALISTDTTGQADGGDVFVQGGTLRISGAGFCETCIPTGILAQTGAEGDAGKITVHAGRVFLETGGTLSTSSFSQGQSGNLAVDADNILLDGEATGFTTQSITPYPARAGDIDIKTNGLTLINGAQVRSLTGGPGRGGDVSIRADKIFLSGSSPPGPSSITSQQLALDGIGAGDAGDINVTSKRLEIRGGANINSLTAGEGRGGNLSVTADNILLVGDPSIIFTGLSNETQNNGNAGNLTVTAKTVEIRDNARIEASTLPDQETGANQFSGKGGNLTVKANDIFISGTGAGIVAKSTNDNPAATSGHIRVIAKDDLRVENRGSITAETVRADAGDIEIHVNKLLRLRNDSSITTSVAGGEGSGGNIAIDSKLAVLEDSSRFVANALHGDGGNIDVHIARGGALFRFPESVIDASSPFGERGTVQINAPETNIIGGISVLPAAFFDASALLSERCTARIAGRLSSFVVKGRGGLPMAPGDWWPSSYLDAEAVQSSLEGHAYDRDRAARDLPSNESASAHRSASWQPGCGG
jgi:filamentous hemagglutinin family protein